jgi:hypothetical protein
VYLICRIVDVSIATKTWNIANSKHLAEEALTLESFTPDEATYIVRSYETEAQVSPNLIPFQMNGF